MLKLPGGQQKGFSAVEVLIAVFVLAGLGLAGWYIYDHAGRQDAADNKPRTEKAAKADESSLPKDWSVYENKDLGVSFAYPATWQVGKPRTVATITGEQGWVVSVRPIAPLDGDPIVELATYPANASIKDVDAGPNSVKVQDIATADDLTFTMVGVIDEPDTVTKPTQMYLSACWPRDCTPRLASGRFLSLGVGVTNNDCRHGAYCPTEINTGGQNYTVLVDVLKTLKTL